MNERGIYIIENRVDYYDRPKKKATKTTKYNKSKEEISFIEAKQRCARLMFAVFFFVSRSFHLLAVECAVIICFFSFDRSSSSPQYFSDFLILFYAKMNDEKTKRKIE